MSETRGLGVDRRTVLKWTAATVAFVGFEIHGTGAAFASGDASIAPTGAGLTPVLVPGAVQAADAPIELGLTLGGSTSGLPRGAILSFEFDPRLYEIYEAVTAQSGSAPVAVTRSEVTRDGTTGRAALTVTLDQSVPSATSLTVVVGHLKRHTYPHDIVRDLGRLQATVRTKRGVVPSAGTLDRRRSNAVVGQPWGCEVGALWQPVTWGGGYWSYCARGASVRSVGPGPVPAGYRLRVLGDPHVVAGLAVVSATMADGHVVAGHWRRADVPGVRAVEWTATTELLAGQQVHLQIKVEPGSPSGPLSSIKHPLVEVLGPDHHRGTQRTTYLESVIRDDSVFDSASRTRFATA